MSELWEILVPQAFNNGSRIDVTHHREWDEKVRRIAGGLTILRSAKGVWTNPQGDIFQEEMIPVRVACTEAQMRNIIDLTIHHYNQEAVIAYRISDFVIITHADS